MNQIDAIAIVFIVLAIALDDEIGWRITDPIFCKLLVK